MSELRRRLTIPLLLLATLAGCGGPRPGTGAPEPRPERGGGDPEAAWSYHYRPGEYAYRLTNTATVQSQRDTLARAESIATTIVIRYRIGGREPLLEITGAVDSFTVRTSGSAPASPAAQLLPVTFRGMLKQDGEILTFTSASDTTCGSAAGPLLTAARELLPTVRRRLDPGTTWEDSTVSTVCRGNIPITTRAIQRYRVRGEGNYRGSGALMVERRSRIRLSGSGTQAAQPVTVDGSGSAESMLYLDPASGRFLGSEGEYEAEINFISGPLEQRFLQRVKQEVTLVDLPATSDP